jgi:hypothetical protein
MLFRARVCLSTRLIINLVMVLLADHSCSGTAFHSSFPFCQGLFLYLIFLPFVCIWVCSSFFHLDCFDLLFKGPGSID